MIISAFFTVVTPPIPGTILIFHFLIL